MIIAFSVDGAGPEARVDPRFGRAPYFLVVDEEGGEEVVANPNVAAGGGAGIQSAQLLADMGVTHVVTGNCGPNAHRTLNAAGIAVITSCSGPPRELIGPCLAGDLHPATEPNVASHHGMGGGGGRGMGGGGLGMGGGRGRGMGGGRGRGRGRR